MVIPFGQYEHFSQVGPPKRPHSLIVNNHFEFLNLDALKYQLYLDVLANCEIPICKTT
jgi:hypothetical protein